MAAKLLPSRRKRVLSLAAIHTTNCGWIYHVLKFLVLLSQMQISTPLNFKRPVHQRLTVLRPLFFCCCFFAESTGDQDQHQHQRSGMQKPGKNVNIEGLSGACDTHLTNNQCSNANTTPKSKKLKLQNCAMTFPKLLCFYTAQIEQIQKVNKSVLQIKKKKQLLSPTMMVNI